MIKRCENIAHKFRITSAVLEPIFWMLQYQIMFIQFKGFHFVCCSLKSLHQTDYIYNRTFSFCFPEIVDGNVKMTLGMIWTIILRFAIQDISVEGKYDTDDTDPEELSSKPGNTLTSLGYMSVVYKKILSSPYE